MKELFDSNRMKNKIIAKNENFQEPQYALFYAIRLLDIEL